VRGPSLLIIYAEPTPGYNSFYFSQGRASGPDPREQEGPEGSKGIIIMGPLPHPMDRSSLALEFLLPRDLISFSGGKGGAPPRTQRSRRDRMGGGSLPFPPRTQGSARPSLLNSFHGHQISFTLTKGGPPARTQGNRKGSDWTQGNGGGAPTPPSSLLIVTG
jgi:hypothetical protein